MRSLRGTRTLRGLLALRKLHSMQFLAKRCEQACLRAVKTRSGFVPQGTLMVGLAQLARAPGCGPGGRRFEPDISPQNERQVGNGLSFLFALQPPRQSPIRSSRQPSRRISPSFLPTQDGIRCEQRCVRTLYCTKRHSKKAPFLCSKSRWQVGL